MLKILTNSIIAALLAGTMASCTTAAGHGVPAKNEIQIDGHPYKSVKGCERKAPIGKFDSKCDIPVVGFSGFSPDTIVPQIGGGGFSVAGF